MIEVIGSYPVVEAEEGCHLIEMRVRGVKGPFDFGGMTQEMPGEPRGNWQVPWMECILNNDGREVLAEGFEIGRRPELFRGEVRFVFFFHYLDEARPLITPFGEVELPKASARPKRLEMIKYEAVD